jgi:hypothetical protein
MTDESDADDWRSLPHFLRQFLRQSQLSTLVAESVTGAESDAEKFFKKLLKTGADCVTFLLYTVPQKSNASKV